MAAKKKTNRKPRKPGRKQAEEAVRTLLLWAGAVHLGTAGRYLLGWRFSRVNPDDREELQRLASAGSPFNIKSDSLRLGDFSREEHRRPRPAADAALAQLA